MFAVDIWTFVPFWQPTNDSTKLSFSSVFSGAIQNGQIIFVCCQKGYLVGLADQILCSYLVGH